MAFRTNPGPVHPQVRRFGSTLKQRVQVLQAEIQKYTSRRVRQTPLYSPDSQLKGDFHRLARRLCGKSIGLVLGGGGARGIAQVGIIRALEEAGIPIDMVGGTSIGAFIGALYARDADAVPMYGRAKKFAGRMGSIWRFALDLTYPSYVSFSCIKTPWAEPCALTHLLGLHTLRATSSIVESSKHLATHKSRTSGSNSTATRQTSARAAQSTTAAATCGATCARRCRSRGCCRRCATRATCCWTAAISTT